MIGDAGGIGYLEGAIHAGWHDGGSRSEHENAITPTDEVGVMFEWWSGPASIR